MREPDGLWLIGGLRVTEAELVAARPDGPLERIRGFELLHGGWRVAGFRLFRPLAYFAAFADPGIFACLKLAVASLLENAGWRWDVLVMTAPDTVQHARALLEPCGFGPRLHVAAVTPCETRLDWCLARYRLDAHRLMRAAQPLLYLDADILCDRPLEPLLAQLVRSDAVHACAEGAIGEGHPDSAGHWFGWRLMAEDDMPFDRDAPGFSAGALGFASAEAAAAPFSLLLRSIYADASAPDGGHRLQGRDQAFANYVLRKLGRIELRAMSHALRLHRLDTGQGTAPDPAAARGMVHFLGAPAAEKRDAMAAYAAALRRGRAAPRPILPGAGAAL
jgi:hypothetical protein